MARWRAGQAAKLKPAGKPGVCPGWRPGWTPGGHDWEIKPGSGVRTFGFFGVGLAHRPDKCNACRGYLERPID